MPAMLAGQLTIYSSRRTSWHRRHLCCSSAPLFQPPTSREVHLWCLCPNEIQQASLLCSYESILPCEERSRLFQAKNKKVQKEYLLTRILARTLLARYSGELVEPSALKFERGRLGKPKVVWPLHTTAGQTWHPPKIRFNISHTRSLIVCAVTGASQVGIDVEEKDRETHTNLIRFARRKFSEMEAVWLEQLDDVEARKHLFLRLWTLKESYGKALGNGIAGTTLRDAAFSFEEFSSAPVFLEYLTGLQAHEQVFQIKPNVPNDSNIWQFVLLQLTNTHYASVCVQRSGSLEQEFEVKEPLHLRIMKTIPLVKDDPLREAVALGLSI
eukprot:c24359_g1_i4 orf=149-1129(+)